MTTPEQQQTHGEHEVFSALCSDAGLDDESMMAAKAIWDTNRRFFSASELAGSMTTKQWMACAIYVATHPAFQPSSKAPPKCISIATLLSATNQSPEDFFQMLIRFGDRGCVKGHATLAQSTDGSSAYSPLMALQSPPDDASPSSVSSASSLTSTSSMSISPGQTTAIPSITISAANVTTTTNASSVTISASPSTLSTSRVMKTVLPHAQQQLHEINVTKVCVHYYHHFLDEIFKEVPPSTDTDHNTSLPQEMMRHFGWLLFLAVRATLPELRANLRRSFNVLLCCLDFVYTNASKHPAYVNSAVEASGGVINHFTAAMAENPSTKQREDASTSSMHTLTARTSSTNLVATSSQEPPRETSPKGTVANQHLPSIARGVSFAMDTPASEMRVFFSQVFYRAVRHMQSEKALDPTQSNGGFFFQAPSFVAPVKREETPAKQRFSSTKLYQPLRDNLDSMRKYVDRLILELGIVDEKCLHAHPLMSLAQKNEAPHTPSFKRTPLSHVVQMKLGSKPPSTEASNLRGLPKDTQVQEKRQHFKTLLMMFEMKKEDVKSFFQGHRRLRDKFQAAIAREKGSFLSPYPTCWDSASALFFQTLSSLVENELKSVAAVHALLRNADLLHTLMAMALELSLYANYDTTLPFPWSMTAVDANAVTFVVALEFFARNNYDLPVSLLNHLGTCEAQLFLNLLWKPSDNSFLANLEARAQKPTHAFPNTSPLSPERSIGDADSARANQEKKREAARAESKNTPASVATALISTAGHVGLSSNPVFDRRLKAFAFDRLAALIRAVEKDSHARVPVDRCYSFLDACLERPALVYPLLCNQHLDTLLLACVYFAAQDLTTLADVLRVYKSNAASVQQAAIGAITEVSLPGTEKENQERGKGSIVDYYDLVFLPQMRDSFPLLEESTSAHTRRHFGYKNLVVSMALCQANTTSQDKRSSRRIETAPLAESRRGNAESPFEGTASNALSALECVSVKVMPREYGQPAHSQYAYAMHQHTASRAHARGTGDPQTTAVLKSDDEANRLALAALNAVVQESLGSSSQPVLAPVGDTERPAEPRQQSRQQPMILP